MFSWDAFILAGLAFWWKFTAGKICAILSLVYGILNVIISSIIFGHLTGWPCLTGWLCLAVAIYELFVAKKISEKYNEYISCESDRSEEQEK